MINEANINLFLKQTSISQNIFEYNSILNDYKFIVGHLHGLYVKDVVIEHKDELKEYLQELYDDVNSNTHTKLIIKEIVKTYYKKKSQ